MVGFKALLGSIVLGTIKPLTVQILATLFRHLNDTGELSFAHCLALGPLRLAYPHTLMALHVFVGSGNDRGPSS